MDSFDYKLIIYLIIASSCLIMLFLITTMSFILNKRFDPDWLHKDLTPFWYHDMPFFGGVRAIIYAAAIVSNRYAQHVFRWDKTYDFRGRVSWGIRILCIILCICSLIYGIAMLVALGEILGFYVVYGH